jgi:hypothetical protein
MPCAAPRAALRSSARNVIMWAYYTILTYFVLALVVPVAWSVGRAYRGARGPRKVTCPRTDDFAIIELDAKFAARMHVMGDVRQRVGLCSRWPEAMGCAQECLRRAA